MATTNLEIDIKKVKAYLQKKENSRKQAQQLESQQTIQTLINLTPVWEKYNLEKVYLYGSASKQQVHHESDIDIAVQGDVSYQQLLELYAELDRHFSREIDIRILEELPFKENIIKKGVLVYEKHTGGAKK